MEAFEIELMGSFSDRVKARMLELGIRQIDLHHMTGVSKAGVNKWCNLDVVPAGDSFMKLCRALQCSPDWLVTGKGTPNEGNVSVADMGSTKIPIINYVQAGCWTESAECRELDGSIKYITTDLDVGGRTFAVEIQGDSMLPEFSEGDVVLIDPDEPHHPGDFVVAKNGEHEATFKKYKPRGYNAEGHEWFELVPLNDNYPPMRSDICQIKIIGTMVEHRRYRRRKAK